MFLLPIAVWFCIPKVLQIAFSAPPRNYTQVYISANFYKFVHPCYLVQFGASEHRPIIFEELLFYYVFKFEQTATYYARLDVVVLREFYPTFDSITIFAELPLGQGIFFSCVVQNRKGSSEVFFTNQYIYLLYLVVVLYFATCEKKFNFLFICGQQKLSEKGGFMSDL